MHYAAGHPSITMWFFAGLCVVACMGCSQDRPLHDAQLTMKSIGEDAGFASASVLYYRGEHEPTNENNSEFGYTRIKQEQTKRFGVAYEYAGHKSGRDLWRVRLQPREPAGSTKTATVSFDGTTSAVVWKEPVLITVEPLSQALKDQWQKAKSEI